MKKYLGILATAILMVACSNPVVVRNLTSGVDGDPCSIAGSMGPGVGGLGGESVGGAGEGGSNGGFVGGAGGVSEGGNGGSAATGGGSTGGVATGGMATGGATGGSTGGATGGATGGLAVGGGGNGGSLGGSVAGSAGGQAGTAGGAGGTISFLRQPPIVQYLINEAASGQVQTTLLDSMPDPLNLSIFKVGSTPAFITTSVGRGLNFPVGDIKHAGAFSVPLTAGNKLRDQLQNSLTGTLEVMADVTTNNSAYIYQIFGIMQDDGENDVFSLWRWDDRLEIDFTGPNGYSTTAHGYYKKSFPYPSSITSGKHIFHVVLDTANVIQADRLRLYIDGVRLTAGYTYPEPDGRPIVQNAPLDIPLPGQSLGATGPNHGQHVSLGGIKDYAYGTGGYKGKIYFAAIHKNALNADEIANAPLRIGNGD